MSDPSHRIVRVVCGALALLGLASCADLPPSGTTDFTLDLRQAEGAPGQVLVQAEYPVVAGTSIVLKSFAQPHSTFPASAVSMRGSSPSGKWDRWDSAAR
jgi:hypothetical protein